MSTTAPADLGEHGLEFWSYVLGAFELEPQELLILRQVCRAIDSCEQLQEVSQEGSRDQRLKVLRELRQQRLTLQRMLGALGLPDVDGQVQMSSYQRQRQRAANVRWLRERQRRSDGA